MGVSHLLNTKIIFCVHLGENLILGRVLFNRRWSDFKIENFVYRERKRK